MIPATTYIRISRQIILLFQTGSSFEVFSPGRFLGGKTTSTKDLLSLCPTPLEEKCSFIYMNHFPTRGEKEGPSIYLLVVFVQLQDKTKVLQRIVALLRKARLYMIFDVFDLSGWFSKWFYNETRHRWWAIINQFWLMTRWNYGQNDV